MEETDWHQIAKQGDYAALLQGINEGQFDPQTLRTNCGASIWHSLAVGGHYDALIHAFIHSKFDPATERSTNSDATVWHWLALGGHYDALIRAIENGYCDPEVARTNRGATVWHWIALGGHNKALIHAIETNKFDPDQALTMGEQKVWKHLALSSNGSGLVNVVLDGKITMRELIASMRGINKYKDILEFLTSNSKLEDLFSEPQPCDELIYAILIMQIRAYKVQKDLFKRYKDQICNFLCLKFLDAETLDKNFELNFCSKVQPEVWLFVTDQSYMHFGALENMFNCLITNLNRDNLVDIGDLLLAYRELLFSSYESMMFDIIAPLLEKVYNSYNQWAEDKEKERFYTLWDSGLWEQVIPKNLHTTHIPAPILFRNKLDVPNEETDINSPTKRLRLSG